MRTGAYKNSDGFPRRPFRKEDGSFAIVYQLSPSPTSADRSAASRVTRRGIHHELVNAQRAERVFDIPRLPKKGERRVQSVRPEPPSLQDFYVVRSREMGATTHLLEQLQSDAAVELAYVAPPRFVQVRRRAGMTSAAGGDGQHCRQQIRWPQARQLPQWRGKSSVDLGVVDSGFDHGHPQLTLPKFEQHLTSNVALADEMGHGTHICGQLAATSHADNAFEGLVPDCAQVRMHCSLSDPFDHGAYYRGLRAACAARLVNLSLSGDTEDPLETALIADAVARNVVVVAAMGNDGQNGSPDQYPARLPSVIAVGAVDGNGQRAPFSNEGNHILISAPGVDILSTVPTYPVPNVTVTGQPPVGVMSGTSMAAAIVTAVVARMLSFKPSLTLSQVIAGIRGDGGGSWNCEIGHGVIDAEATLSAL
jgi:Subtilase family